MECRVAHSSPLCLRVSRSRDPFPTEKACSEKVRASYSLSNRSESGSTQKRWMKFFR